MLLLTEAVTIIDVRSLVRSPRWKRPYRDPFKIIPAAIATFGTVFFAAVAIAIIVTMDRGTSHTAALALAVVGAFGLVWLTFAWRMYRTALLLSDTGVRVRWLLLTRTFAWSQVAGFDTAPDHLVDARLWIVLVDGGRVRTPVQRVMRRIGGSFVADGGTWLLPDAYDRVIQQCRGTTGPADAHGSFGQRDKRYVTPAPTGDDT